MISSVLDGELIGLTDRLSAVLPFSDERVNVLTIRFKGTEIRAEGRPVQTPATSRSSYLLLIDAERLSSRSSLPGEH